MGALDPGLGEALAQGAGQGGAAVLVEVDHHEVVGAEGQQRIGDGHPRSPGTELDDLADRLARQPGADRGGEAGGVGVVADRAVVGEDDRVDGAEALGRRVEAVEVLDDELLARVGDVEGVEAEQPGVGEDPADVGRLEAERGDVDGAVDVGQVVGRGLPHVQCRGERRADAGAHQAHEVGVLLHRWLLMNYPVRS